MSKRTLLLVLFVFTASFFSTAYASVPDPQSVISGFSGKIKSDSFRNRDNLTLHKQAWIPESDIKAVCLLIPGTAFHTGAYDDVGKYLAANGYAVYGIDLQGWGQSQGQARNGYVDSYDDYVNDVSIIARDLKKKYPDKKIFVIGENIGAIVPLYGQIKNDLDFDGFIFSGAIHKPNPKVIFRMPEFAANWVRGGGLFAAGFFPFQKMGVVPTKINISLSVADKSTKKKLKKDPNVTTKWLPVAWGKTLLEADKYVSQNLDKINEPILILHGEKDATVPIRSSEEIYDQVSSHDKELKVIRESGNAVLLDKSRFDAMQNICIWLDDRCHG